MLLVINLLATIQIVNFYVEKSKSYLDLRLYAMGQERMPFQGRLLMEYPMRWAYSSSVVAWLANLVGSVNTWFHVMYLPQGLVQLAVNIPCVLFAGLVARDMYRHFSGRRLLTAYVYPLFLVMVAGTYCLLTIHFFRYVYDLPALALFSAGLYLIYRRKSPLLFAAVFIVATINRETSLFLLFFYALSYCLDGEKVDWRRALDLRVGGTVAALGAFWIGWHVWVMHHFAANTSESKPRLFANFVYLIWPFFWPELAGVAGFLLPVFWFFKSKTRPAELRVWMWMIPVWVVFVFLYGMLMEIRLFGELLPLFACLAVLLAEERILSSLKTSGG